MANVSVVEIAGAARRRARKLTWRGPRAAGMALVARWQGRTRFRLWKGCTWFWPSAAWPVSHCVRRAIRRYRGRAARARGGHIAAACRFSTMRSPFNWHRDHLAHDPTGLHDRKYVITDRFRDVPFVSDGRGSWVARVQVDELEQPARRCRPERSEEFTMTEDLRVSTVPMRAPTVTLIGGAREDPHRPEARPPPHRSSWRKTTTACRSWNWSSKVASARNDKSWRDWMARSVATALVPPLPTRLH